MEPSVTDLTIEQLAHETGMTVRNIRNHQSRGLLPPPEVRGRIGYYGEQHVARLRMIQELQAEGFKLDVIKRLLGGASGLDPERFMGLRRLVTAPFETESPEILAADELIERFGPVDMKALEKAQRLGLLVPIGDGRFEAPSPAIVRAAEEVIKLGVPLPAALAAIERAQRHLKSVAHAFVQLFLDELWIPFDKADQPDERWPEITDAIERLRPLVSEVVLAAFKQTMSEEVEKAFGKVLERQAKRGG
jgi:DNA-binding transcriptional MerR regulator